MTVVGADVNSDEYVSSKCDVGKGVGAAPPEPYAAEHPTCVVDETLEPVKSLAKPPWTAAPRKRSLRIMLKPEVETETGLMDGCETVGYKS